MIIWIVNKVWCWLLSSREGIEFLNKLIKYAGVEQEWIVLRDEDTDPKYGVLPYKRGINQLVSNGVINIDKPPGPTSHEVVAWIKRLLGLKKAGHGGTLDPKVTGVLPVALENATKVIGNVVHTTKEYVMVIQLHEPVDENRLREALNLFVGRIYQKPPLRSSVKRTIRIRTIYYIDLLEYNGKYALVRVGCEAGTYMRKLAHDLGLILGVGAHMRELRRTRTGPFREDETLVRLQELNEAIYLWREEGDERLLRRIIMPVEVATSHLPKVVIRDSAVDAIAHGAHLAVPGIARLTNDVRRGGRVAIYTLKGELVALGHSLYNARDIAEMKKGIVIQTMRVYMRPGTYPSLWKKKKKK